jgi:hypothetical protein
MLRSRIPQLTSLALLTLSTAAPAQGRGPQLPEWLAGCWRMEQRDVVIEEQWMAPRGGSMLAMSRTTRGSETIGFELVVLRVRDGELAYEARPSNQPSAVFALSEATDSTVVFANPEHDFPQRIGYQRVGSDSLRAWTGGTVDGNERTIVFPYARAACPSF